MPHLRPYGTRSSPRRSAPFHTEVAVGGFAAESKDFNDYMKSVVWFVFAFVLGFAFLLLLAFRSLVIAAKAIVLNLLSVAAAYGILVPPVRLGRRSCSASSRPAASFPSFRSSSS